MLGRGQKHINALLGCIQDIQATNPQKLCTVFRTQTDKKTKETPRESTRENFRDSWYIQEEIVKDLCEANCIETVQNHSKTISFERILRLSHTPKSLGICYTIKAKIERNPGQNLMDTAKKKEKDFEQDMPLCDHCNDFPREVA